MKLRASLLHLLSSDPASPLPPPDACGLLALPASLSLRPFWLLLGIPHFWLLTLQALHWEIHGQEGIPLSLSLWSFPSGTSWLGSPLRLPHAPHRHAELQLGHLADFALSDPRSQLLGGSLVMKPKCRQTSHHCCWSGLQVWQRVMPDNKSEAGWAGIALRGSVGRKWPVLCQSLVNKHDFTLVPHTPLWAHADPACPLGLPRIGLETMRLHTGRRGPAACARATGMWAPLRGHSDPAPWTMEVADTLCQLLAWVPGTREVALCSSFQGLVGSSAMWLSHHNIEWAAGGTTGRCLRPWGWQKEGGFPKDQRKL